ncbi:MAG: hypothetical protein LBD84_07450, partial [Campylobacteraceae bacterium]|nr:hypothetical protein [Campylobacteraceae bacterium]
MKKETEYYFNTTFVSVHNERFLKNKRMKKFQYNLCIGLTYLSSFYRIYIFFISIQPLYRFTMMMTYEAKNGQSAI